MSQEIGGLLEQLIGLPGGLLLFMALGLILMHRYRRLGFYMTVSGLALLYIACLPVTAFVLMSWLEPPSALNINQIVQNATQTTAQNGTPPQAIVILGAGRRYHPPEYVGDIPNASALERIRYGVWLARRTLLPMLVTGGLGAQYSPSEAEVMKKAIESDYAMPVRWIETQSRTTYENAEYSAKILKAEGINSIYLVTHALHMKRSVAVFEKFGLTVFPAPTAFNSNSRDSIDFRYFLPSSKSLDETQQAFHEWVGMLWYSLRN